MADLDESEKLTIQSIGRDHVAVGIILIALSESLLSLRRVDAAVQAARCAVTILEKGLPPSHWRIAVAQLALTDALWRQGEP